MQQQRPQQSRELQGRPTAPSPTASPPCRHPSEESWVDIASRPSSSSLSSAADNEIVTTGLRVQHDSNLHRRQRRARSYSHLQYGTGHGVASPRSDHSSQDEYDESESESDWAMTSSTEGIGPSPLQNELKPPSYESNSVATSEIIYERQKDGEDEDDENATAVNYPRSSVRHFEPRPNAFSHRANQHVIRPQSCTVYAPSGPTGRPSSPRRSYSQRSPHHAASPNSHTDHDAALRASLSTLLSAAAAVRGLPKPDHTRPVMSNNSARIDPTSLRLVPESIALGEMVENPSSSSSPRTVSSRSSDKSKRKTSPQPNAAVRSGSKDRRVVKKARSADLLVDEISPTLLTWVVSAGVVVLVSALSFSAGYVVGKEAGHAEALGQIGSAGVEAGRCGKEAASGLRGAGMGFKRLQWTSGSGVRV